MSSVRLRTLSLTDNATAREVLALQKAAYAVEARLIGTDAIPPLHDNLLSLQMCGETFIGAYLKESLAGAMAVTIQNTSLDICRLMVHPDYFRQGVATALLNHVLAMPDIRRYTVSTGAANHPAKALYTRHGFREIETMWVDGGVQITRFELKR